MKVVAIIILSLALIFVGTQIISAIRQEHSLAGEFADVSKGLEQAKTEEQSLSTEVNYLSNPVNFEKELRGRFNYAKSGETMLIIVSSSTSIGSASSSDGE